VLVSARAPLAVLLLVACLAAGCGSDASVQTRAQAPACQTRAAWQRLADRIHATVLCPTWMPTPIDARIGGDYGNGVSVKPDRAYLVSFLWHESDGSTEVHVNFRGYPGRTAIPRCLRPTGSKSVDAPCFSDPHGTIAVGGHKATLYTANLDADQWHVLYAWHQNGSLYTASMHVAAPYQYARALTAIRHVVRSLVPIRPR